MVPLAHGTHVLEHADVARAAPARVRPGPPPRARERQPRAEVALDHLEPGLHADDAVQPPRRGQRAELRGAPALVHGRGGVGAPEQQVLRVEGAHVGLGRAHAVDVQEPQRRRGTVDVQVPAGLVLFDGAVEAFVEIQIILAVKAERHLRAGVAAVADGIWRGPSARWSSSPGPGE